MEKISSAFNLFLKQLGLRCSKCGEKISSALNLFLEWLGQRCSKCGSWKNTTTITRRFEWGSDTGGIVHIDPFIMKFERRNCTACGHEIYSKFAGTEEIVE